MPDCPKCEEPFETKAAMHAHHKRTHGEALPIERLEDAVCIGCEQEFTFDPQRRQGEVCLLCAEQFPGIHNSSTIKDVVRNMDPEDLKDTHNNDGDETTE